MAFDSLILEFIACDWVFLGFLGVFTGLPTSIMVTGQKEWGKKGNRGVGGGGGGGGRGT